MDYENNICFRACRACAAACVLLVFMWPFSGRADSWTNAAGHSVEAKFIRCNGGSAIFERPDGTRFEMPLASLAPAARQRIAADSNTVEAPEPVRAEYRLCVMTLKRLRGLREAGGLDNDEYLKRSGEALARLERACARSGIPEETGSRLVSSVRNF